MHWLGARIVSSQDGRETQSFARYEIDVEISIAILVFTLGYFQEKVMTKFSKKSKKPILGHGAFLFWFCPKFGQKMNFHGKKTQILNIPIIYHRAKNHKKIIYDAIPEENTELTDE